MDCKHTYAFNRNHRLFKISHSLYLVPKSHFHPSTQHHLASRSHSSTPFIFFPHTALCLLQSVSQCFPQSRVWSGLLFSRKFIAIVSAMSAKPSLCNATPKGKCSSYNLDLKLDDFNRCKHRGGRATDLIRAVWIPETSNPTIFSNTCNWYTCSKNFETFRVEEYAHRHTAT